MPSRGSVHGLRVHRLVPLTRTPRTAHSPREFPQTTPSQQPNFPAAFPASRELHLLVRAAARSGVGGRRHDRQRSSRRPHGVPRNLLRNHGGRVLSSRAGDGQDMACRLPDCRGRIRHVPGVHPVRAAGDEHRRACGGTAGILTFAGEWWGQVRNAPLFVCELGATLA